MGSILLPRHPVSVLLVVFTGGILMTAVLNLSISISKINQLVCPPKNRGVNDFPNTCIGFKVVTDWIVEYFTPKSTPKTPVSVNEALLGASPIVVTDKMPLILQHNGHSRTIVGYEISSKGHVKLLTFDPAKCVLSTSVNIVLSIAFSVLDKNTRNAAISFHNSSSNPPSSSVKKKRLASAKHSRHDPLLNSVDSDDDEVIIVSDLPEQQKQTNSARDTADSQVLNRLRLDSKKFGLVSYPFQRSENADQHSRKKQYQILYFPMTAPLTKQERIQRKEVTSTKVC